MKFQIAIPALNAADYLDGCLASLFLLQPGDFDLHVHVQDGGSSDDTLGLVDAWRTRIERAEVPHSPRRVLTGTTAPDAGLYHAVSNAFIHMQDDCDGDTVMTWLGSDDLLLPGALSTVNKIFQQCTGVCWITGQPQTADLDGAWHSSQRRGFARRNIRWGLHDGRCLPNLMQEGTFWRSALYRAAGGLRSDLKLAGDFDLWRRFAEHSELLTCSFPLAVWTHRPGQASRNRTGYYAEVDALRAAEPWPEAALAELSTTPFRRRIPERPLGADYRVVDELAMSFEPREGFSYIEAALPELGIDTPFMWTVAPRAVARLEIEDTSLPLRVSLRLRVIQRRISLRIRVAGQLVFDQQITSDGLQHSQVIEFPCHFAGGQPEVTIEISPWSNWRSALPYLIRRIVKGPLRERPLGLLVEDLAYCVDPL